MSRNSESDPSTTAVVPYSLAVDRLGDHFNIYDPELPYVLDEVTDRARGKCPVLHTDQQGGYYLVTGYDEVAAALATPEVFSSKGGKSLPVVQTVDMPPIDSDDPEHHAFRKLLNRFFSKAGLAKHEPAVRQLAKNAVDSFIEGGKAEFVHEFAEPIVAGALCRVILELDDPGQEKQAVKLVNQIGETNSAEAWANVTGFISDLVTSYKPTGRDTVFDAIATGQVLGRDVTAEEKLGVVLVLFLGGLDTTKSMIGNILRHCARTRGLEDRLRDPSWTRSDLDEFLRLDSVVTGLARTVTSDTELGGVHLHAGDRVILHYYGANHDPAKFDHPHQLDFGRERNPHVAFATGAHRCIGSNFARLQISTAFTELMPRVQNIRFPAGVTDILWKPGIAREPMSLELLFDKR
ncbi:MAG TPA: cytochrome P450 [Trebonia sp.]|jgi:cytochrome P450